MRVRFMLIALVVFGLMYVGYQHITAQNLVTCPDLVQKAVDSVGNNCGSLQRNSACYGFNSVQASFSVPQPEGFFTAPSDRAKLLDLQDLITSPMQEADNKWGIALLSIQANLPDTLPGQSVVVMLLGDTQVENAVAPDQAFQTGAVVSVTMQIGAQLYFTPDFNDLVIGSVPTGTKITADAISSDGQWVRVVYSGKPGWVTKQVITTDGDLTTLPVITPDTKTPMQAFYFRTSISGTQCTEAPNALVVQGPKNLTVDINANGADMRIGSTIALYLLPVDPTTQQYLTTQYGNIGVVSTLMQIIVLDGHVVLNKGKPNEVDLKTGETSFICMSDPENLGLDGLPNDRQPVPGCPWAPGRTVTLDDIEQFKALEGLTLNYPIELPYDILTPTPTFTSSPTSTVTLTPTNTATFTNTPTFTPSNTSTFLPNVPTFTSTHTATVTNTPTITNTATITNTPTNTPTPTDTGTATDTLTPTSTGTDTLTPTDTPTNTATATDTPTVTPTATDTPIVCNSFTFPVNIESGDVFTFIAAINAANDPVCHPEQDTIKLNGTYSFGAVDNTDNGPSALPSITSSIIILGSGSTLTRGVNADFRYLNVASGGNLTLNDLSLTLAQLPADFGGAIYNAGTLDMTNVTVSGNLALIGGGIYSSGSLHLLNSTVSENTGTETGYGIQIGGSGSAVFDFVTMYGNSGGGSAQLTAGGSSVIIKNTLIGGSATDCEGTVAKEGDNLSDDGSCSITMNATLGVSSLAPNGGGEDTNALDPSSPAVEGVSDCSTHGGTTVGFDQRGIIRPQNYPLLTGPGRCDIGAFELEEPGGG